MKTIEAEIIEILRHPEYGLKDSSNTNKRLHMVMGLLNQYREEVRKEAIDEVLEMYARAFQSTRI